MAITTPRSGAGKPAGTPLPGGKPDAGAGGKGKGGHPADGDNWDTDNTPRKSDTVDYKAQLRAYDRKMTTAYESGRSGMPADPDFDDDEAAAHRSGAEEAAQPAASAPVSAPSSFPSAPSGGSTKVTQQGAPLILGMVGYCLAVNWIRYGWPGVTGWFTAKFENKVTLGVTAKPGETAAQKAAAAAAKASHDGATHPGGTTTTDPNGTTHFHPGAGGVGAR